MLISSPGFATELDPHKLVRSPTVDNLANTYLSFDDKENHNRDVSIQVQSELPEFKDSESNEELDKYGLPKKRKIWSKRPACSALIMLVIGGLIGKFVLCS